MLGRIGLVAVLTLAVVGCDEASTPVGSPSAATLLLPGREGVVPLSITDPAGILVGVTTASDTGASPGIDFVPGRPDALRVDWIGGACDVAYDVRVVPEEGISVFLTTRVRPGGCLLVGILRSIQLNFVRPVADQSIHLELG